MTIERRGRLNPSSKHIIKHNLTGNKYGKYIPRKSLENEIVQFLRSDNENYQIISGLGGMGKSSLIFSVLSKIINNQIDLKKTVDSIIWVTDSYNPGDLNIDKLVDEINTVYGSDASTQYFAGAVAERRETAKKHLNLSNNMLSILVVDNFETVKDDELRRFIFELPQTCKVILTSKINREACIEAGVIKTQNFQCINDFPIPSFTEKEWYSLFELICDSTRIIKEWAKRFEKEKLNEIVNVIFRELGGIPFPFERVLTQIAEKGLIDITKIKQLVTTVVKGTGGYERVISYSWKRITRQSQAALMAAALSGYLSYINFIQLSSISGLLAYDDENSAEYGSELDVAVDQCLNYKLIDKDTSGICTRYYLPAMVYRYVINIVQNDQQIKRDFSNVIDNWISFYKNKTQKIGMCYNNTEIMREFDSINQKESLQFVLDYCYSNSLYNDYVNISNNMRYFFYTRSIWKVGDNCVHIKRAYAAHQCGDYISELEAYVYYINIASKYRQFLGIEKYIKRVEEIIESHSIRQSAPETYFRYKHTMGLYYYHNDDFQIALSIWKDILKDPIITSEIHDIDAAKRWYTKCLIKCTENPNITDIDLISEISHLLAEARAHNFERAIIDFTLMLVMIYTLENHRLQAKELLFDDEIKELIDKTNDVLYKVKYYLWCAFYCDFDSERIHYLEEMKRLIEAYDLKEIVTNEIKIYENEYGSIFE